MHEVCEFPPPFSCCCTLDAAAEALRAHGLEVEVSLDAGQFLCNLIYFSCLLRCQREGSKSWHALFVHVPPFSAYPRER